MNTLEASTSTICAVAERYAPEYDVDAIYKELH